MADDKIKLSFEIDGLKDANKQISQLEQAAEDLKKQLEGVEEGSDAFNKLNGELVKTTKQIGLLKDATGQLDLDKKFEDVYGEAVPLNTQLGELEDRMYALAAAGLQNTEGFKNLQDQVVNIRQTIIRVDESVDDLAANKGLSTFGTQIAGIGESLMTLDFERAAKQAQGLANNVGNIKFGNVISGVKNLGSTFISLGKALLANPIFLIAAAIAAIIAGIAALMKKLGILKPVLDAIGKVFGVIGDAIDWVIQKFKDFTDWLGITNNAAEEFAENQAKAAERAAEASAQSTKSRVQDLDQQIRMLELEGMESEKQIRKRQALEKEKLQAISETSKLELDAAKKAYEAAKEKGDLDAEEMKALRLKVKENRLAYQATVNDITYANAAAEKEIADFNQKIKDEQDAKDKEEDDKRKENAAKYKQYLADRLAAARQAEDLRIELIEDDTERELEANRVKYQRLIEDTKSNEKLRGEEKTALIAYYEKLSAKQVEAINKAAEDKQKAKDAADKKELEDKFDKQLEIERAYHDMKVEANEGNYAELKALSQDQYDSDLYELDFKLQQELITQEEYDLLKLQAAKDHADRIKEINDDITENEEAEQEKRIEKLKSSVDETTSILTSMAEATSSIFGGILASLSGSVNSIVDLLNQEFESVGEKVNAWTQAIGNTIGGVLTAISDANQAKLDEELQAIDSATQEQQALLETQLNSALITKEEFDAANEQLEYKAQKKAFEARKKAFEDDKKLKIAQAVISGIQGAVSAFTGAMQLGPIAGPIVGGILAAAVAAMTAINVSKIKSTKFGETAPVAPGTPDIGGGGGGASSAPTPPSINLFGQANEGSEGRGQQQAGLRQQTMVKAIVVESDITNTQNRLSSYQQRSEIG